MAMTIGWQKQLRAGAALRGIVQEATAALISMDRNRLEGLARCCVDLNRELEECGNVGDVAVTAREVAGDLKLLGCILYETRANLTVLSRLRQIRIRRAWDFDRGAFDRKRLEDTGGSKSQEWREDYGDN